MSQYFPERKSSAERLKIELDLFNYATKADKKGTGIGISRFSQKVDLANLKFDVD